MTTSKIYLKSAAVCCPEPALLESFAITASEVDNALIPATMRRRTSLTTRMAITAATLACQQAGVNAQTLPSVFASLGGEIQITDALCRLLPDPEALLSPTQFHNSVHNTTAGYWSILNQAQAPTTAIAAADDGFAMGLLEAWSQLQFSPGDLLLVCYDEYWPQYLAAPIGETALACALILSTEANHSQSALARPDRYQTQTAAAPLIIDKAWAKLANSAPAAAAIPLLQALAQPLAPNTPIPLNHRSSLWFTYFEKHEHSNHESL